MFWRDGVLSPEPLRQELRTHSPSAAVLFCNVLGQLPLEGKVAEGDWQIFLRELRAGLHDHPWASYHDLFSISPLPHDLHLTVTKLLAQTGDIHQALTTVPRKSSLEVTDHMMNGWAPDLPQALMPWSLTRSQLHIIAALRS
jgi:hypothetical protein